MLSFTSIHGFCQNIPNTTLWVEICSRTLYIFGRFCHPDKGTFGLAKILSKPTIQRFPPSNPSSVCGDLPCPQAHFWTIMAECTNQMYGICCRQNPTRQRLHQSLIRWVLVGLFPSDWKVCPEWRIWPASKRRNTRIARLDLVRDPPML